MVEYKNIKVLFLMLIISGLLAYFVLPSSFVGDFVLVRMAGFYGSMLIVVVSFFGILANVYSIGVKWCLNRSRNK